VNSDPDSWQKLTTAFKATRLRHGTAADPQAPTGFATRIAARVAAGRRAQALALWRRWSLCFAIGSTCLFFLAALFATATPDSTQIVPLPHLSTPATP